MENRAYAVAAGAFTLLLLVALAGAAVWLTGETTGGLRIDLVSRGAVSGLSAKAAVRMRGVDVGQVERIGFSGEDPRQILVRISVNPDTPLTRSTYARLSYQGVTGLSYVELDDDASSPGALGGLGGSTAVPRIELRPSRLDQFGESGQLLLSEAEETARRVNQLLSDGNLTRLSRTLENIEAASSKAAVLAEALQPTVKALPRLVAHADATVQQVGPVLSSLDGLARGLQQRMDVLDHVARNADRIGDATEGLERAVVSDALPRFRRVMDDVERNSQNLDRLLVNLNDQPQSILFGRTPSSPDPGEPGFRGR
jgi:phospholipid/cholesterol/gamma-HCH transport system substrate-binding protein